MIADILTVSRIIFSVMLPFFPQHSFTFAVLYLFCGVTDVLDGLAARKLHTESEKGAMLDSAADLVFAAVYALKILPSLPVPLWIWIWTVMIAGTKITGIMIAGRIEHSLGNKLTGLLLFLLPLLSFIADVKYGATIVCIVATVTTIMEIRRMQPDITG